MSTEVASALEAIPEIIVTEPSPLIQNPSITPHIEEMVVPIPEEKPRQNGDVPNDTTAVDITTQPEAAIEQATAVILPERDSSGEFTVAEDCSTRSDSVCASDKCTTQLPQSSTASSEPDHDDEFRTTSRCCPSISLHQLIAFYEKLWEKLENRYVLPFWIIAMISPLSAAIMGGIYMYSCPVFDYLPVMIFMIGISLMAVLALRVSIIIHRLMRDNENSRTMLQTLNLMTVFITCVFCVTESVVFWQMNPRITPGATQFCHPTFTSYAFYWNIATAVLMFVILIFPVA